MIEPSNDETSFTSEYVRTVEDVKDLIVHSKLKEDSLLPVSQAIYFADDIGDHRLLQLDQHLLDKLKKGERLVFRGDKDDKAVLCTDVRTYEVKEAETSNSLLLLPTLEFPEHCEDADEERVVKHIPMSKVFKTYLEVKPCKPSFRKLVSILEESSYRGSELEEELIESGITMYTLDGLLKNIQASKEEIMQRLKDIDALLVNGYYRLLEFNYQFRVLSYFLNLVNENSWQCDQVQKSYSIQILNDLMPSFISQYIVESYTEKTDKQHTTGEYLYSLKEKKICRFLGEFLLKSAGRFNLEDFLKTWQESVPEGLTTNLDQLEGLAILDMESNPKAIRYFPECNLPDELPNRMQQLFRSKTKWTTNEIQPYIRSITDLDINTILMKYARASMIDGVRVYSSKYGK